MTPASAILAAGNDARRHQLEVLEQRGGFDVYTLPRVLAAADDVARNALNATVLTANVLESLLADARWFVPNGSSLAAKIDEALHVDQRKEAREPRASS